MANTVNIYVNKADLGLDLVDNTADLDKPISTAQQNYVDTAISNIATPTLDEVTTAGNITDNPIVVANVTFNSSITPSQIATLRNTKGVYLDAEGEVWISTNGNFTGKFKTTNLTQDITLEMPVKNTGSYTIATTDLIGAANGLAELDGTGKVPSSQLPSYVDDVEEYADLASFPVTGESGKIYIALDTNLTYRWGGSTYVEISPSLALGETIDTAYRGDRGKTAYDHSQLTSGNPHNVTKSDVALGNVDNTSDVNKPISTATQTALNDKADKNITLERKTASYTLVAADNGKMIEMDVAGANTLTIDASLFSAGNQILISQYGAGQTTITAGAGVTLRSSGAKLKTSDQYSLVTIIAISSTEFYVAGDLTA